MMPRIVSYLLVCLQFVQALALPHSHAEAGATEPADHARRPHIHLGGLLSHRHGLEEGPNPPDHDEERAGGAAAVSEQPPPAAHHDSDAVYVSDETLAERTSSRQQAEPWHRLPASLDTVNPQISAPSGAAPPWSWPPPYPGHFRCPLFLQTLALLL